MRKTNFWLVQILMVAIVGLVMGGSPALAFDDAKWHAMYDKKVAKHIDKNGSWAKKLAKHEAKYHPSGTDPYDGGSGSTVGGSTPTPPASTNCVTILQMNPLTFMLVEVVVCS